MKKKILHIIVGLGNGGAENTLFKLLKKSKNKFDTCVLVLGTHNSIDWKFNKEKINIIRIKIKNKFFIIFKILKIYYLIKRYNPDLIQTWMYHSDFVGSVIGNFLLKKKVIWCIRHTSLIFFKSKFITIIIAKFCSFLSKKFVEQIIYSSTESKIYHQSIGYDKSKGIEILNGYDPKDFTYLTSRKDSNKIINLGILANYRPQKDFPTFFKALSILNKKKISFQCIMAGHNIDHKNKQLSLLIKNYNLSNKIFLLGELKITKYFFKKIDYLVLSSSFGESFPNVLAEAMLHGIPCVSTEVGSAKKIINGLGWICKTSDPIGLSKSINQAIKFKLTNIEEYKKLKKKVRSSIIKRYHIDYMTQNYFNTWEQVLKDD